MNNLNKEIAKIIKEEAEDVYAKEEGEATIIIDGWITTNQLIKISNRILQLEGVK